MVALSEISPSAALIPPGAHPRILIVSDEIPPEAAGLSQLLARSEWRFVISSMAEATEKIEQQGPAAPLLLPPRPTSMGIRKI